MINVCGTAGKSGTLGVTKSLSVPCPGRRPSSVTGSPGYHARRLGIRPARPPAFCTHFVIFRYHSQLEPGYSRSASSESALRLSQREAENWPVATA